MIETGRILLVDDEPNILSFVSRVLRGHGHVVDLDYLTKPFALAELLARVRTRLRLSAAPAEPRFLRVADITLDLQRRVAETPTRTATLSSREFALLAHLMRRAGEVCSKEELLEEVWGYDFDVKTNVVEVNVGRLRAKLGTSAIETLRNLGYSLRAT